MKRILRPIVLIQKRFSSNLPVLSIYLGPDELKFYQKVEDDRRREFNIPTMVRHREAFRKPIQNIDENNPEQMKEFRAHMGTILDRLNKISQNMVEPLSTGILQKLTRRWQYTNGKLPEFPDQWTKSSLVNYLEKITERKYYDKLLSSHVGIVQAIIKDLVRLNNPETLHSLSPEAYKTAIIYFIRDRNIRAARELVQDMQTFGINPDVDIFNALLYANRMVWQQEDGKYIDHPLKVIENLLDKMYMMNIPANYDTWNAILLVIPIGSGKGMFLEAMQRHPIPLFDKSYDMIVSDIASHGEPKKAMEYLEVQKSHQVAMSTIGSILTRLFEKRQHIVAWNYLRYAVNKWSLRPTTETLNSLSRVITQTSPRVDWIMGIASAMEEYWGVQCNGETYLYMLRCAQSTPYHRNKFNVLETIHAYLIRNSGAYEQDKVIRSVTLKAEYYTEKGVSDRPLNLSGELTLERMEFMNKAKETLKWDFDSSSKLIDNVHYGARDSPKSLMAFELGIPRYQHNLQKPTFKRKVNEEMEQKMKEGRLESRHELKEYEDQLMEKGPHGALHEMLKRMKDDGREMEESATWSESAEGDGQETRGG